MVAPVEDVDVAAGVGDGEGFVEVLPLLVVAVAAFVEFGRWVLVVLRVDVLLVDGAAVFDGVLDVVLGDLVVLLGNLANVGGSCRRVLEAELFGPLIENCLLYTSPSPRDGLLSRMPSSA